MPNLLSFQITRYQGSHDWQYQGATLSIAYANNKKENLTMPVERGMDEKAPAHIITAMKENVEMLRQIILDKRAKELTERDRKKDVMFVAALVKAAALECVVIKNRPLCSLGEEAAIFNLRHMVRTGCCEWLTTGPVAHPDIQKLQDEKARKYISDIEAMVESSIAHRGQISRSPKHAIQEFNAMVPA